MPTRQRANSRKIWLDSLGLNLALRAIQVASATPNVPKQGNTTLDRRALFDAPVLDMDTAASLEEIFDQVRSELELVISLGDTSASRRGQSFNGSEIFPSEIHSHKHALSALTANVNKRIAAAHTVTSSHVSVVLVVGEFCWPP